MQLASELRSELYALCLSSTTLMDKEKKKKKPKTETWFVGM